jgi:hypothetical protein
MNHINTIKPPLSSQDWSFQNTLVPCNAIIGVAQKERWSILIAPAAVP